MEKPPTVCVFAHPDDEAFGPAGTIAHLAKTRDVYIICATNGDSDPQFTKHKTDVLGQIRPQELIASSKILGVKDVIFLNFKDGSLNNNSYHKLADALKKTLKKHAPDTLLTYASNGISGHLDHVAVSLVTSYVFYRMPGVHKIMYLLELEEKMKRTRDEYFVYMPPGIKKSEADLVIDTTPYWEKRVKSMYAHKSQKSDADMIYNVIKDFPKEEYFKILEK